VQAELRKMGELAMRALLGTARSSESILRAAAAESLGQLANAQAVPTLKYLVRDGDLRVRQAAEEALKALGAL
jgi:HEAT repeat protein